jgi:predicted nuclease of predicted toxin-antitoxin system
MDTFVIDVNLPLHVPPFQNESCIYISLIDDRMPDSKVWDFAKENAYTIITKDSDFSQRILLVSPPPKIIHIRFGNLKLKEFISLMSSIWPEILEMHKDHKLVNVHKGWIEGVN